MQPGNQFFQNKGTTPALFPNSNMTSSTFIPKINANPGFPSQVFPQSTPNFFNNPVNLQQQTNPHLFPPFQGNTGAPFPVPGPFSAPQPINQFNQQSFPGYPNMAQQNQQFYQYPGVYQPAIPGFNPQQNPHDPFNNSAISPFNQNSSINFDRMQTSYYTPYQEDRNQSSYMSRHTLNEIVSNLDSKLSDESKSPPQRLLSKFPYNPFERRNNRRADIENREPLRNTGHLYPPVSQTITRNKPDDAFTLIKKSRYIEDDVEIIMRPKVTIPPPARNRSYSPTLNRSRETIGDDHRRGTGRNIYNNTIKLRVHTRSNAGRKDVDVRIYRKALVFDLKVKVLEALRTESLLKMASISLEELAEKSVLSFNDRHITDDRNLDQIGLDDSSNLVLHVGDEPSTEEIIPRNRGKLSEEVHMDAYSVVRGEERQSISKYVPKLTKEGYSTIPSIEELSRMSDRDLAMVENFTVTNQYGKIEFEGKTDVRGVDLDELVVIYNKNVEVYPEDKFPTDSAKPIKGEKLNKPAMITLYNCTFPWKYKGNELKKKLEHHARKMDCEFIDYDETNGIYRLRVTHF